MSESSPYIPVIGLEVHVQLTTQTKLFAYDENNFGAEPNSFISDITIAHPGALPLLNQKAVEFAVRLGLSMGCEISKTVSFDRKNYFYPDLPKGFQVTQDANPICKGGGLNVKKQSGEPFFVSLTKIHMEEDAGKSIHDEMQGFTFVDLNRAGVPLLEIVTEPVIKTSHEAAGFMAEIRKLVRYLGISDGNMEEGSLRCDANISIHRHGEALGNKVEVKNMNSFRNVARAIEIEVERQIALKERGEEIISETRTYDPDKGTTKAMRSKELLNDYRYFPEPDVAYTDLTEERISEIKGTLPLLPWEVEKELLETYHLSESEAQIIGEDYVFFEYFRDLVERCKNAKAASNWLIGPVKAYLNENRKTILDISLSSSQLAEMIKMISTKELSNSAAQKILPELIKKEGSSVKEIARDMNLIQERNVYEIVPVIEKVLDENKNKVKEYQNGKKGLVGMFMGLIMKESKGKIDPQLTNKLLVEKLENYKL